MKIKEKMKVLLAAVLMPIVGVSALSLPVLVQADPVYADVICDDKGKTAKTYADCSGASPNEQRSAMGTVRVVISVILGVLGMVAVVMIVLGGVNYTTSQGDPGKVKKAKDTIMYGIIGLVVAMLAFAIVNFVLQNVFNGS